MGGRLGSRSSTAHRAVATINPEHNSPRASKRGAARRALALRSSGSPDHFFPRALAEAWVFHRALRVKLPADRRTWHRSPEILPPLSSTRLREWARRRAREIRY